MAWIGVVTDVGAQLLGQYRVPGTTLYITKVETGKGIVPEVDMRAATALDDPVDEGEVTTASPMQAGTQFRLSIGAYTSAYVLKEVGIFAKVDDGDEVLLALLQNSEGVSIAAYGDFPDFVYRLSVPMPISNTDNISFTVDPNAYVSYSEFAEIVDLIGDTALPTTAQTITGAIAEIFADAGKPIMPSTAFAIPASGSSVSYNMEGITADHRIILWQFSVSAENSPPASLSWTTYAGYFTITNNGGTTSESIQPVFAIPNSKAITAHT